MTTIVLMWLKGESCDYNHGEMLPDSFEGPNVKEKGPEGHNKALKDNTLRDNRRLWGTRDLNMRTGSEGQGPLGKRQGPKR